MNKKNQTEQFFFGELIKFIKEMRAHLSTQITSLTLSAKNPKTRSTFYEIK